MTKLTIVAAIGVLSAISSLPAMAGSGPAEREHDTEVFSAGEPGDPEKPSRVIQVTMQESDGKMVFVPNHVEVRKGEENDGFLAPSRRATHVQWRVRRKADCSILICEAKGQRWES